MAIAGKTDDQPGGSPERPEMRKPAEATPRSMSPEAREAQLRQFAQGRIVSAELLHGSRVPRPKEGFAEPLEVEGRHQEPMEQRQIEEAIENAEPGIAQYLEIMELLPKVNVTDDPEFQRKFNRFYRVRQRSPKWYKTYFSFMEHGKHGKPTFDETLDHLWNALGRYEPSFSSKLVVTLDPAQPIWDAFVLRHTRTKSPSYMSKTRVAQAKAAYESICSWYRQFLGSADGKRAVSVFNSNVKEHARLTDVKKVDFVLWQTRAEPGQSLSPGSTPFD